jgi:hypothetical protein
MPRTLHIHPTQSAQESNFCRAAQSFRNFSRPACGSKLNLAKVLRKYMTLGVYSDAQGDHFLSPLAGLAAQTAAKIESYGRQPDHFERINAREEKMRLGADQFLFIRDGLFIFLVRRIALLLLFRPHCAPCVFIKS